MASRPAPDYVRTAIDRTQGRSLVMTTAGVVASEHPLASQAGAAVLAMGGHAVDAAIAANAVMGVVAPMMNGIGGDLFAVVHDASSGATIGLNASGPAPAGLTLDRLRARGMTRMPQTGIHSVTVPGAVDGWAQLSGQFGRLPLADVLAPAIAVATTGVPLSEITAREWASSCSLLSVEPEASRVFLPRGRAPEAGEVLANPDLAASYRTIASSGRDGFYAGDIARLILECSDTRGGTLSVDDLAGYSAEWVEPLSTTYRGWTVYELPPNGQGIAALMMLNLMEHSPMGSYGHNSADALHTIIEAKKLAYADMERHLCDPAFSRVPVDVMLSKDYAAVRARRIDAVRAMPQATSGLLPTRGSDTTYLAVADRYGNLVSLIQSNFANFGSGIVPEGTGFVLQSRGGLFSFDASHPNALEPGKRPLHTIIPGFMVRDAVRMAFGIMGGWNQSQAHAQFVSNVVDHGMNIQAALEAARVTKLTFHGCDVMVESRVPASACAALAARGHDIEQLGAFSSMVGGGQAVSHDVAAGVNAGGSDPRKDGAAVPEPYFS